jgi:hypothetical protein
MGYIHATHSQGPHSDLPFAQAQRPSRRHNSRERLLIRPVRVGPLPGRIRPADRRVPCQPDYRAVYRERPRRPHDRRAVLAVCRARESVLRQSGGPTSEIHTIRKTVKTLRSLYDHTVAKDFGPLALKTCRQQWIDEGITRRGVNRLAQTVRAIFRWGAENELVPVATWQALTAVTGLKWGRSRSWGSQRS